MPESFVERRKRELREAKGGSAESASSFLERRRRELRGQADPAQKEASKNILDMTLDSVTKPKFVEPSSKPIEAPKKTVDFKAEQAKKNAFDGKLPAASLLIEDETKALQNQLKGKLPAAELVTANGGIKEASKIPGITQYEINKKEIDKAPPVIKQYAQAMNYLTEGNPLGIAVGNALSGNSGVTRKDSSGNKTVDKAADIFNNLVTPFITPTGAPTGSGPNVAPYEAAGKILNTGVGQKVVNKIASTIPKVKPDTAQRIVNATAKETLAGPLQNVAMGLQQGQDSGKEIGMNALYGAAGGLVIGGAGAALSEVGGSLISKLFKQNGISEAEIAEISPQLALPEADPRTVRKYQANQTNTLASGTDPIADPYTFKLDQASPNTMGRASNAAEGRTAVSEIDTAINDLNTRYEQAVIDEYKVLKQQRDNPQGVNQGSMSFDAEGNVTSRQGRLSNNQLWYQQAMKENNYQRLSNKKLYELARKHMDEGFDVEGGRAPAWKVENGYDEQMSALTSARETMNQSVREIDPALTVTDAPLVDKKLKDTRVNGQSSPYKEPVIRDTTPTREQIIASKNPNDFTQEDIDFMLSDEWDNAKMSPDSIKESTYVKPRPIETKVKPTVKAEVAATTEIVKPKIVTTIRKPLGTPKVKGERGFTQTLKASDKTPDALKAKLSNEYEPITNQATVDKANARLDKDVDAATNKVLSSTKFDAETSVTAQRLIDHYNKTGNYEMSVTIADKIATEATKAGQFIQSLSVYNRITPEGVLIHAQRIAKRINETGSKIGKEAVVTEQMASDIVGLAGVTQKMTGVKDLSNSVIDILERAKGGEKLNPADASTLQKFVEESKQFIKETTKKERPAKAPRAPKDKRVRESLVTFLDAQEEAAKARLRAKGVRISSTPIDIWADYAVIGAAKMGKNIVKLSEWSEAMVKDFGEDIRPHLQNLYNRSVEAFELSSAKVSRQTISEAEKLTNKVITTKELSENEAQSLIILAQKVSGLSGEAKRTASQDLQYILQMMDKPSFGKKLSSAQTIAQLLNPKTQVRNVLGNELFYRIERLNKLAATPIDIARSKITGGDRYVTFRNYNQGQFWKNFMMGAKAGWKGVNINGLETQFDLVGQTFRGNYNPMKWLEKSLGASLRGFDNAAYMRAYNDSLGELATLDALNKGLKPSKEYTKTFISKADENIQQIADSYGKYVTFQDNNLISQGLTKFKKGLNLGKDFGAGDLILKYPKTPGALLMRALEYSPAGFLRSAKIAIEPLLKNGIEANPAEVTQALTRAIIGTFGLSGLGYYFMENGVLSGEMSKDKDIRSLESSAGQGQYQVNLSALFRFAESGMEKDSVKLQEGDLLYNYDWMQPVSVAVSMGANINKNLREGASGEKVATGLAGAAFNSVAGGINTLTEQSVLQGLQRAASGYPGQTVTDKIVDVVSDIPASFIPTIFNQVKQLTDNSKRETYSPNKVDMALNKAQSKIPGLAGKLPKKYDTLGNEQKHYQDNNPVNVFLNPGFPSRYKLSEEARLIVDLITETGDESLAPRVPGKSMKGMKLTGEQFSRLSQLQGEQTKERLSKIKTDIKTSTKVKKVDKALDKSGESARKQFLKEYPGLVVK